MILKLVNRATDITDKIDSAIKSVIAEMTPRQYLGGSYIGKECERDLWYSYHYPQKIEDTRIHRIMDIGHLFESYALVLLKRSGYEIFIEDENGKQFGFDKGIFKGNIDGCIVIDGVPHLLEIKSANDKRFKEMVKMGIRSSDPVYFYQVQAYMREMDFDRCLFFVINKNNCEIHAEYIDHEPMESNYIINRGLDIVKGEIPNRKYKTKAFFKCSYCSHKSRCWDEE